MARVVVVPLTSEVGHLNPTFALARALARRGHEVVYLARTELEAGVRRQGFRYAALYPDVPLRVAPPRSALGRHPVGHAVREALARVPWNNAMFEQMLDGRTAAALSALSPDAVLVDNMWPQLALVAHALGVPTALLATTPSFRRGMKPPGLGGRVVDASLTSLARVLGLRFAETTRRLAATAGLPAESFDYGGLLPRYVGERLPELLLFPPELDAAPGRHVGPSVDVERAESACDLSGVPADHDLVYCALGTRDVAESEALAVFRPLIAAVSQRPRCSLVLAAGAYGRALGEVPPTVTVLAQAPQMALLRRARAMVTHGGLGSIKECLYFGVPMVVLPLRFDQKDNAARVQAAGLGIALTERNEAAVARALDAVLDDSTYRRHVAAASASLRAMEARAEAVSAVEGLWP